jgi:hypothetical protein
MDCNRLGGCFCGLPVMGAVNPPPSVRYLDAWIARTRRVLGKPALPALGALPDDVRRFVERMD